MTNEQLAEFIQQGGNDELLPLLWEKTHKLIYMHCSNLYRANMERFKRHGIDEWDLKQSAYEGLLIAVKAYNRDKEYKFTTYLPYSIKKVVRDLIGVSGRRERDLLNISESLDRPISEDDTTELSETISDEAANIPFQEIERADINRVVREEVDKLPDREREAIQAIYFKNKTLKEAGEILGGISPERARQYKSNGLRKLRKSDALKELHCNSIKYSHKRNVTCFCHGSMAESDVERWVRLLLAASNFQE